MIEQQETQRPNVRICWSLQGQLKASGPVEEHEVGTAPLRVGRGSDANLRIKRPSISTRHADVVVRDDVLWLTDLGSTNGTYVNGKRIHAEIRLVDGDLIHFADAPFRVCCRHVDSSARETKATLHVEAFDMALSLVQFDRMISERALVAHYQPIVAMGDRTTVAMEVLARSKFPGLDTPSAMFRAAGQLGREIQLSQLMREIGVEQRGAIAGRPMLFLNTHPAELGTQHLTDSLRQLRRRHPNVPIVLEIHESAVANGSLLTELRNELTELNIGLAYDDFGVGESRLAEIGQVSPDFVKFDMALIRDIHLAPAAQRQLLRNLVKMVHDCGARTVAEGVEREEEHETLAELGFQLGQGFFYSRGRTAETGPADLKAQDPC